LALGGVPVTPAADFQFRLYDVAAGGAPLAGPVARLNHPVKDGLFTILDLDFGVNVFDGRDLFLDIAVRVPPGAGAYTVLSPRQRLAPTPYALQTRGLFVNTGMDVGIGTTSPTEKVHIAGPDAALLVRRNATSSGALLGGVSGANVVELYNDGDLAYRILETATGLQTDMLNVDTSQVIVDFGSSFADGSGFLELNSRDSGTGIPIVRMDADSDNAANGVFPGLIRVRSSGTGGLGGELDVQNNDGSTTVSILGGASGSGGSITLGNAAAGPEAPVNTIELLGDSADGGYMQMWNAAGNSTVILDSDSGGGAAFFLRNDAGSSRVFLDGDNANAGSMTIYAADGSATVFVDGEAANSGGLVSCRNDTAEETVQVLGDDATDSGRINVYNREGSTNVNTIQLEAQEDSFGTGSRILGRNENGNTTWWIDSQDGGGGAWFTLYEDDGSEALLYSVISKTLSLKNAAGSTTITMNGQTGAKSAVQDTESYGQRLLYCQESTEVWFEDLGSGRLVNGEAYIALDPMFLETVTISEQHPLKVFVTLTDDCNGIFVRKGLDHFVVKELAGGMSHATFDYRAVAKRRGLESVRLEAHAEFDAGEGTTGLIPASVPGMALDATTNADELETGTDETERTAPRSIPAETGDSDGRRD
jgi:hypothetical protein